MMKQYNRVCARIDLDAIEYNMEMMHKNTREGVSMISVIKTDGYGHGAVQIARMLEPKDYIWGYAVATLDEAVVLRKRGIKKPILVLGCIFPFPPGPDLRLCREARSPEEQPLHRRSPVQEALR